MKTVIITNYTYDASLQTIIFNDFTAIDLRRVVSVVNVTRGAQMYFYKSTTFNGAIDGVLANKLVLNFDADGYANDDQLVIEYIMDNVPYEILPSAARVINGNSADLTCYSKGAKFVFDITAAGGVTPELTIKVQEKDHHGNYIDITGAVTTATAVAIIKTLIIDPDHVDSANYKVNRVMPRTFRLAWTITGGGGQTFTFRSSLQPID